MLSDGYESCARGLRNLRRDLYWVAKEWDNAVSALFRKCKPAVERYWLMLLAGALWTVVGTGLCLTACVWLAQLEWPQNGLGVLAGFGSGILIYRFGFSRLATRNLMRIATQPVRVCIFAFQAWRSYLLIAGMMVLGGVLRHSSLSLLALGIIYAAMGTGLTLGSAMYYENIFGPHQH